MVHRIDRSQASACASRDATPVQPTRIMFCSLEDSRDCSTRQLHSAKVNTASLSVLLSLLCGSPGSLPPSGPLCGLETSSSRQTSTTAVARYQCANKVRIYSTASFLRDRPNTTSSVFCRRSRLCLYSLPLVDERRARKLYGQCYGTLSA